MKSLDKAIRYHELILTYDDTSVYPQYELPEGFRFIFFEDGDEAAWVSIHVATGEFDSEEEGYRIFHSTYDSFYKQLNKRMVFIEDIQTGEKVGTGSITLLSEPLHGYTGKVDWIAVKESYQGRGLSRPLISRFMKIANDTGHNKLILYTQTNTWLAVKLYLDSGFEPFNTDDTEGWGIIRTLTEHEKLSGFKKVPMNRIFKTETEQVIR